jgi:hypothetical protein
MLQKTDVTLSSFSGFASDRPAGGTKPEFTFGVRVVDQNFNTFDIDGYLQV